MRTMKDDKPITGKDIIDVLRGSDEPAVRKAVATGNVEMAPADKTLGLQPWIDRVLEANGIRSAWISDLSTMGDFVFGSGEEREARRREVAGRLGMDFNLADPVVDVARRLKAHEEPELLN
jgi:hypothetical protein